MRQQPRQIYTSVRSPDGGTRAASTMIRIIVIAVLVILVLAMIIIAALTYV